MTTESDGSVTLTIRVFSHPGGAPRPFTLVVNTEDGTASNGANLKIIFKHIVLFTGVAGNNYVPVIGEVIQFNRGDVIQTHTITINDDNECVSDPNNIFFSNISLLSGIPDITLTVPQATVTINDSDDLTCG